MAKGHLKYLWWLMITSFLCVISIILPILQVKNTESSLDEYFRSKTCPSPANCRKVTTARIMDSNEVSISIPYNRGRGISTGGAISATYTFSILTSESKNETVTVVPDLPSDEITFDVQGVYVPSSSYLNFVKYNFYDGEPIQIETWHHTITFLFVDEIQDPTTILVTTPVVQAPPKDQPLIIGADVRPKHQVAIPTTDNPVVAAKLAKRDFWRWGFFAVFMTCFIVVILFFRAIMKSPTSKRNHDQTN